MVTALEKTNGRFQILALDGGGIKGIFSSAILAAIEKDLSIRITDHFDLIAGTSTGGIIAIGLGLGFTPEQILEFYLQEGKRIFANRFRLRFLQQLVRRKFSSAPLSSALRNYFAEKRFGDSTKRLLIPCYNLGEDDVYIFRTAHHENLKRDYKVAAWKVALSTSAAPNLFSERPPSRLSSTYRWRSLGQQPLYGGHCGSSRSTPNPIIRTARFKSRNMQRSESPEACARQRGNMAVAQSGDRCCFERTEYCRR